MTPWTVSGRSVDSDRVERPALGVVSERPVLDDHPEQLADEERVALGAAEQRPDDQRRRRPAEEVAR